MISLHLPHQANAKALLTNTEIIAIDQDADAVMASKINTNGRNPWATDLWIKPLSDGDFVVAFVNKDSVPTPGICMFKTPSIYPVADSEHSTE